MKKLKKKKTNSVQKTKLQALELLAPVGSFPALTAAINAGCDSVYFGVTQLNMRARSAHNFKISEIAEVAQVAKEAGIKAYIALNTLLYPHDMDLMRSILDEAKKAGIDAVIVADIAAIMYARKIGMPVHASTQLSISNFEAVKFYSQFADTIVLAREVDLKMMKNICDEIKQEELKGPSGELVKIEVFVHGALCIAPGGRCEMSILQTNTSAQRGACLQECRKKYRIIDDESGKEMMLENQYVLSPKDLCTIGFLDKIVAAGASVFKIEGRGRTPNYVDVTVRMYREALDAISNNTYSGANVAAWVRRLAAVFNRGFCDGYYLGKPLPELCGSSGNQATEERIYVGLVKHYFDKAGIAEILLEAHSLALGDRVTFVGIRTGVIYADVNSIMKDEKKVESAKNPCIITVPIKQKVRPNDKVYLLQKPNLRE